MKYIYEQELSPVHEEDVRNILYKADNEFVPPLSARASTTQSDLKSETNQHTLSNYFDAMSKQSFILAMDEDRVVGFLSYIPNHPVQLEDDEVICSYASTIVVDENARGQGITEGMYKKLFDITKDKRVGTRTWSQNHAHIHILEKMGFELALTLKDDRGPGVDTVYYIRGI